MKEAGLTLLDIQAILGAEVLEQHRLRKEIAIRDTQIDELIKTLAERDTDKQSTK